MRPWLAFVIHVPVVTVSGVPAKPPYVLKGPFTVVSFEQANNGADQAKSLALLAAHDEIGDINPTELTVRLIGCTA